MIQKKGQLQIGFGAIIMIIAVVLGAYFFLGNSGETLSVSSLDTNNPSVQATAVTSSLGLVDDDDLNNVIIKLKETDLNDSEVSDLQINSTNIRNDVIRDLDSAGYLLKWNVKGLAGYDSWNNSVDDKQYAVEYDESTGAYDVTINSVSFKVLPAIVEYKQGTSKTITIDVDVEDYTELNKIVEDQYDDLSLFTLELTNENGQVQSSIEVVYTRTTA